MGVLGASWEGPWGGPVLLEAGGVGVLPSPFKTASEELGLLDLLDTI